MLYQQDEEEKNVDRFVERPKNIFFIQMISLNYMS